MLVSKLWPENKTSTGGFKSFNKYNSTKFEECSQQFVLCLLKLYMLGGTATW